MCPGKNPEHAMKALRQLGRAIVFVVALAAVTTTLAQTPPLTAAPVNSSAETAASTLPAKRPRIGLALSGGGARGIAHIGVLKVLDEMRIPISCVTGTSMGAIVGGTFASGRTPEEMEKFVVGVNWDEVFRDKP